MRVELRNTYSGGLPDRGLFAKLNKQQIPLYGVWIVVAISIIMGLLQFASAVAVNGKLTPCFNCNEG